jgi:hypothetical protein
LLGQAAQARACGWPAPGPLGRDGDGVRDGPGQDRGACGVGGGPDRDDRAGGGVEDIGDLPVWRDRDGGGQFPDPVRVACGAGPGLDPGDRAREGIDGIENLPVRRGRDEERRVPDGDRGPGVLVAARMGVTALSPASAI